MFDYNKSFFKQRKNKKISLRLADVGEVGAIGSASFYHNSLDFPVVSTQEIKVDWSRFDRHTFFSSAAANVNVAFDKIINHFPFDGNQREFEEFLAGLSGFEKYIFDSFPKHKGQLRMVSSLQNYISVEDATGNLFPSLSKNQTGQSVLNPGNGPYTIEAQLFVPNTVVMGNQIIAQKYKDGIGITLGISSSVASATTPQLTFIVNSGSYYISSSYPLTRGRFNHVCATMENDGDLKYVNLFVDEQLVASSNKQKIDSISPIGSRFLIGSGVAVKNGNEFFTPTSTLSGTLDEFRVFSDRRTINQQKLFAKKSVFSNNELELYYKFNEPQEQMDGSLNAIVLDSSGNSLHSTIQNFDISLRESASDDPLNPLTYEQAQLTPILFPSHPEVVALNAALLTSASAYDDENPNIITRLIPSHYLLEGSFFDGTSTVEGDLSNEAYSGNSIPGSGKLGNVQIMLTFLYTWAKFFDDMKLYIDNFSGMQYVDYESNETIPNNFLSNFIRDFGLEPINIFNGANIEQYVDGQNIDYFISGAEFTLKNLRSQIMRRLLSNMQPIIASKGTLQGIKAFFRTMGLDPDTALRLREYGGSGRKYLKYAKEKKVELAPMISFLTSSTNGLAALGTANIKAYYLSGSRSTEPGFPQISNSSADGLFTSGSWTVELQVKYPPNVVENNATESICRLQSTTGIALISNPFDPALLANVIVVNSASTGIVKFYSKADYNIDANYSKIEITIPNFFDGTRWSIGFGRQRFDDINSSVSSSYFLRVASQLGGEIINYFTASSFYLDGDQSDGPGTAYSKINQYNVSGTYISIGKDTIPAGTRFLNRTTIPAIAKNTNFSGFISNLNFWSKAIDEEEWKEHITNPFSVGVANPVINFDYEKYLTGSFERLRLSTLRDLDQVYADSIGNFTLYDSSGSDIIVTGSGFSPNTTASLHDAIFLKHLTPYFDENLADEKVRPYGFLDEEEVERKPWRVAAPAYQIPYDQRMLSPSVNFTAEISLIDALNRDIINILATYESMAEAIGSPELLFSANYPDVEKIREVYFNKLVEKLNFKKFFEFYRWLDLKSFDILSLLLPKRILFKGVNFVVESHVLERHKLQYYYSNLYLLESDKKLTNRTLILLGILNS